MREIKASFPAYVEDAAFFVDENCILKVNPTAAECGIRVGEDVRDMIYAGYQEYTNFKSGLLYLELIVQDRRRSAAVMIEKGYHLFCLLKEYDNAELKAMALAGHYLVHPLQESLANLQLLEYKIGKMEDEAAQHLMDGSLKRNLFQMMRAINNMKDASRFPAIRAEMQTYMDISEVYGDTVKQLHELEGMLKRKFIYKGLNRKVITLVDRQALERAFYNLISNAVKFSPAGSPITIRLTTSQSKVLVTVTNKTLPCVIREDQFFTRYLRQAVPESLNNGIGLGMNVVRTIASAHKGAVFIHPEDDTVMSVTMTVHIADSAESLFRNSSFQVVRYGGYDTALTELSDVLPMSVYEDM